MLYSGCDYLSMLVLKLIQVSKGTHNFDIEEVLWHFTWRQFLLDIPITEMHLKISLLKLQLHLPRGQCVEYAFGLKKKRVIVFLGYCTKKYLNNVSLMSSFNQDSYMIAFVCIWWTIYKCSSIRPIITWLRISMPGEILILDKIAIRFLNGDGHYPVQKQDLLCVDVSLNLDYSF